MPQWLSTLISASGVGGFVLWLVKRWIDDALKQQNTKLKATLNKQKALFDAVIGKQMFEHQTVYPRLYDKSLEVVTESYIRLARFSHELVLYTNLMKGMSGGPSDDEQLPKVVDALDEFRDYFYGHRIYVPKIAADEIDTQTQVLVGTANVYRFMVHKNDQDKVDWVMIEKKIRTEMQPAIKELEKTYRTLVRIEAVFPGFDPPEGQQHPVVLGKDGQ